MKNGCYRDDDRTYTEAITPRVRDHHYFYPYHGLAHRRRRDRHGQVGTVRFRAIQSSCSYSWSRVRMTLHACRYWLLLLRPCRLFFPSHQLHQPLRMTGLDLPVLVMLWILVLPRRSYSMVRRPADVFHTTAEIDFHRHRQQTLSPMRKNDQRLTTVWHCLGPLSFMSRDELREDRFSRAHGLPETPTVTGSSFLITNARVGRQKPIEQTTSINNLR